MQKQLELIDCDDSAEFCSTLKRIEQLQSDYVARKSNQHKKSLGQFFTPARVAQFMASFVSPPKGKKVRILDSGAGIGILTAATVERCIELGCEDIHAVLYELDQEVVPYLIESMKLVIRSSKGRAKFTYELVYKDFVLERPDKAAEKFDVSVINPPYFKYNVKTSPYGKATTDLYKGNPNIYASFIAVAIACMRNHGQVVVIAPRSFTNGLYFKGFRNYVCDTSSIENIHVFVARDQVFRSSNVLQENVIFKYVKKPQSNNITIGTSQSSVDIKQPLQRSYPVGLIIDSSNGERIIRIPENKDKADILVRVQGLESTFTDAGYYISTGRVVDFRTKSYITSDPKGVDAVPLLRTHNITPPKASWTGDHRKDRHFRLVDDYHKHLVANTNYVLLKRLSSKDERRRLVAAVYTPNITQASFVGIDNKINYLGVRDGYLSHVEADGLATLFNSTFFDKYFRCLSGNTQVNATEIRVLRFPSRASIKKIGRKIQPSEHLNQELVDRVVSKVLGI